MAVKEVMENSIIYKKFKKFIREALRISSTNQKKVSSDRHKQEAITLLEAERERAHIIIFLRKILKSQIITRTTKTRTQSLVRKRVSLIIKEIFIQFIYKEPNIEMVEYPIYTKHKEEEKSEILQGKNINDDKISY
jgi:hypothetical protein